MELQPLTTVLTGTVVTATDTLPEMEVTIDGGVVQSVTHRPGATGPVLVPGFIDLHNHGGDGGSFPTGTLEQCRRAAEYHRSQGTTTLLASMVSAYEEELTAQVARLRPLIDAHLITGFHLEGPFIAAARKGAQSPDRIQPGDAEMFERVIAASGGNVRQITFAPETEHALDLLEVCREHGVIASLGHTDADFDTTAAVVDHALKLGVTVTATHLFNAMPQIHHRAPGPAAAMLERAALGDVDVELIADGTHLADNTVDTVLAAAGEHCFAVTDAMEAAGMPDGQYGLGPLDVTVDHHVARLTHGGAIAGGTSTLGEQFTRFAARHGLNAAVRFTSTTAARVLGVPGGGLIEPGQPANIVAIDDNNRPQAVYAAYSLSE